MPKSQNYHGAVNNPCGSTLNHSRHPHSAKTRPRRHFQLSKPKSEQPILKGEVIRKLKRTKGGSLLHLPLICLLRPLSVPRTLPHPLQIRFQTTHTKGEKPRKQWGFREDTQPGGDSELGLLVQSLSPAPQFWYRSTRSKLPS